MLDCFEKLSVASSLKFRKIMCVVQGLVPLSCLSGLFARLFVRSQPKKCQGPPAQPRRLSSYDDLGPDYVYGCLGRDFLLRHSPHS